MTLLFKWLAFIALSSLISFLITDSNAASTVPQGCIVCSLPATGSQPRSYYFSVPLTTTPIYTGTAQTVTKNDLTVSGTPWSGWSASGSVPYYFRITEGQQAGRTLRILANTPNALLADITDGTPQSTALNLAGFALRPGDGISIFSGYTLATLLGDGSAQNSLRVGGGSTSTTADTINLYNPAARRWVPYYYNTLRGKWERPSALASCNSTPIPPGSAILITRRANRAPSSFVIVGEVQALPPRLKSKGGSGSTVYTSPFSPIDIPLGAFVASGWKKNDKAAQADAIGLWNPNTLAWESYFQRASDSQWRRSTGGTTSQNAVIIPAGAAISVLKRTAASGAASFPLITLPYDPLPD